MTARKVTTVLAAAALFGTLAIGCGKKDKENKEKPAPTPTADPGKAEPPAPTPAPATADAKGEAKKIYDTLCTACHGATGKGDGAGAASLNPKPRDYSDAAWQKSVTDDDLAKVIVEGGQAIGKSPLMPANPALKEKPEVVKELVAIIRGFAPQ